MDRANRVRSLGLAAVVLAVTSMTYVNSLDNGFHFDDEHSLTENPHIRTLGNVASFFTDPQTFSRNPGSEMYRPLVVLSYALNFRIRALEPRGFHLVNLLIHLGVVGLLAALLVNWGWDRTRAAVVACLFGVHPLASEPVNYISSRSESMAVVFVLASVLLYSSALTPNLGRRHVLSLLCFVAALMSKSSAVALLLILPLVEAARRDAFSSCGDSVGLCSRITRRQWPYWSIGALYLWGVRELAIEALIDAPVRSMTAQLMTQCKGLVYYAKLLLLPHPLTVDHAFRVGGEEAGGTAVIWLSALCVLSVAYIVWRGIGRGDRSVLFVAWIGAVLLPTIVVPLNVLVTERRLYLVVAVFLGFVAWQLRDSLGSRARSLIALTLCVFAALTVQRNPLWASELTLWEDAVIKAPASDRAHVRLGVAYRKLGRLREARAEFERALELRPLNAPALNNLGNVRKNLGDSAGAEMAYAEALEILPSYPEAMINLATLHNEAGRHQEALDLFRRAQDIAGPRPELLNNLGTTYLKTGEYDKAEEAFERALLLRPKAARVYFNLGGALEGQKRWERAVAAYESAIRHDASYPKPYYHLALLHERFGRRQAAVASYRRFVDLWRGDVAVAASARRRLALLEKSGG